MKLPKINLPPIDPKLKIIGLVGILALVIMGFYDHVYKPHAKAVDTLRGDLESFTDKIEIIMNIEYPQVADRTAILRLMEEKKAGLSKTIQAAEQRLAGQGDTSKLLETLTSLANAAGMNIKTLEPKAVQNSGDYFTMPLVLDVTAQFEHIVSFLQSVKNLPVVLSQIQISVRERPQLSARLVLTIHMK